MLGGGGGGQLVLGSYGQTPTHTPTQKVMTQDSHWEFLSEILDSKPMTVTQ